MTEAILALTMLLLGAGAVLLTLVGLPGTWLYLLGALLAQWCTEWITGEMPFAWWTLGAALLLCVLAEVAEGVSGAMGAAKAGASKRALVGAAIGGLIGAIVGTIVLSMLPLIGTIIGGAIGGAIGAVSLEMTKPSALRRSRSLYAVGKGAAIGRLLSTVIKSVFAAALVVLFLLASIFAWA